MECDSWIRQWGIVIKQWGIVIKQWPIVHLIKPPTTVLQHMHLPAPPCTSVLKVLGQEYSLCTTPGQGGDGVLAGQQPTSSSNKTNKDKVLFYNSYNILSKMQLLRVECPLLQPDIIMIAESFARSDISDAYLRIAGYEKICRSDGRDCLCA